MKSGRAIYHNLISYYTSKSPRSYMYLKVGNEYYYELDYEQDCVRIRFNDYYERSFYKITFSEFKDHFYTLSDLRKLKLKKIEKIK